MVCPVVVKHLHVLMRGNEVLAVWRHMLFDEILPALCPAVLALRYPLRCVRYSGAHAVGVGSLQAAQRAFLPGLLTPPFVRCRLPAGCAEGVSARAPDPPVCALQISCPSGRRSAIRRGRAMRTPGLTWQCPPSFPTEQWPCRAVQEALLRLVYS